MRATRRARNLGVGVAVFFAGITGAYANDRAMVSFATAKHAYLNVGRADGIVHSDILHIELAPRGTVTCTVDNVSEHHARCAGNDVPRGAFFVVPHAAPPMRAAHVSDASVTPISAGRQHIVQMRLAAAPAPHVEFENTTGHVNLRGRSSLRHEAWFWLGVQPRGVQDERLDLAAYAVPFQRFPNFSAQVRLTALMFSQADVPWSGAAQTLRFGSDATAQFFLWQGELAERGTRDHLVFSVGRILPWYVPGLAVLDGAQIGYRETQGRYELGVFGGTAPNLQTLVFDTDHGTFGVYAMQQANLGARFVVRNNARLGVQTLVQDHSELELETRHELTHDTDFQMGVTPRFNYVFASQKADLEAIRGDISAGMASRVRFYAGARYANDAVDIADGLLGPASNLRSTFFSDALLEYAPINAVTLGVLGSWARDNHLPFDHTMVGPQIGLPRLFGRFGGVTAIYMFEGGTYSASSTFLQAALQPSESTRLWLRGSFITDTFQTISTIHEISMYARLEGDLTSWLHLGGFMRVNQGLYNSNVPDDAPYSILGSLQLTGTL